MTKKGYLELQRGLGCRVFFDRIHTGKTSKPGPPLFVFLKLYTIVVFRALPCAPAFDLAGLHFARKVTRLTGSHLWICVRFTCMDWITEKKKPEGKFRDRCF